jgi:Macrocin-O-methyltransferase (TylF)
MCTITLNNELTQKNETDIYINSKLLELHENYIKKYKHQWNLHSLTTMNRQTLSRIIFFNQIYKKIIKSHGVIFEFGVQWGTTLTLLMNMRGIYEPYNASRKIIGFDTFKGLCNVGQEDGPSAKEGDYNTNNNYKEDLEQLLSIHELNSPLNHIKKFELVNGDASNTVKEYIDKNPETIISLAIFDMDIYKPTKDVLSQIMPRMHKGSIILFDELCCPHFPGETTALLETLDINKYKLKRSKDQIYCSYIEM